VSAPAVEFLNAVDWVVADLSPARDLLSALFPHLVVTGELDLPDHGFASTFFRGPAPLPDAPTRIQLVRVWEPPGSLTCDAAPFLPMQQAQGLSRHQRVHGTVLAVANFDESIKWLAEADVPVYVERECVHLPYPRAWLGWSDEGQRRAEGVDGGLFLELIPIEAFPPSVRNPVTGPSHEPDPGLRALGRVHLVDDLGAALRQLWDGMGLTPAVCYEDSRLGMDAARFSFRHPASADLVVAQPTPNGPAARYRISEGLGVYVTTIRCPDGPDVVERAHDHGVTVTILEDQPGLRALLADESTGILLEIIHGATDAR
jgi:hypothetical protein